MCVVRGFSTNLIKMENKIKTLITELKNENKDRSIAMNDEMCTEYGHTVLVHKYNNTLDIIKRLELLLK